MFGVSEIGYFLNYEFLAVFVAGISQLGVIFTLSLCCDSMRGLHDIILGFREIMYFWAILG